MICAEESQQLDTNFSLPSKTTVMQTNDTEINQQIFVCGT